MPSFLSALCLPFTLHPLPFILYPLPDFQSILQSTNAHEDLSLRVDRIREVGSMAKRRIALDQVNIVVKDMDRAVDFYRRLGLEVPDTLPVWQPHHRTASDSDPIDEVHLRNRRPGRRTVIRPTDDRERIRRRRTSSNRVQIT